MIIGTPRLCIVLVNTRGVQSDEMKDKVFHALVNPRIPLSDRQEREIHPRVKDLQRPRLGKPRRGLQIFDTRVDFPVPAQSRGRFL